MKKYTKETIFDYLLGNDIKDFDIDELESNPKFMADVVCKDKKAYNLCSYEIKANFEFAKKVIENYKNDIDFVVKVFDNYQNSITPKQLDDDIINEHLFELNIIMRNITKNSNDEIRLPYVLATNISFSWDEIIYEYSKQQYDEETRKKLATGFEYQKSLYGHNKTIMNFIAERYIEQIFFDAMDLEENLHRIYKTYEKYEADGKYKVIVQFISYYDKELASYVAMNAETLSELNKEINRIKNNWNTYNYRLEEQEIEKKEYDKQKYSRIIDRVKNYCDNHDCSFDHYDILAYVGKKFGVLDQLKKYVINNSDIIEIIHMMIDNNEISKEEGYRIIDSTIKEIKEAKENGYSDNVLDSDYPLKDEDIFEKDKPHLNAIIHIFEDELGYKLKDKKNYEVEKINDKVLKFKIRPLNK